MDRQANSKYRKALLYKDEKIYKNAFFFVYYMHFYDMFEYY